MLSFKSIALSNRIQSKIFNKNISVLYIPGDKAKENYAPLTPYMDFRKRLDTMELQENITRRGLNIDLKSLQTKYKNYLTLKKEKNELEQSREDIRKTISQSTDSNQIDELKSTAINLRNKLKSLKETIYPVENDFVGQYLSLPNDIHGKCPQGPNEQIIYRNGLPKDLCSELQSHLHRKDLIHFMHKECYYLFDEAAEFEVESIDLCRDIFTEKDFVSMTNPDFTRKVLLEASLTPYNQYHGINEEDQRHHLNSLFLTGGGSFESFLGYFTKLSVFPSVLPLRLISTGREYKLKENEAHNLGLYAATQSNVIQTLVATSTREEADRQMDDILNLVVDFYKKFGIHFRIVFVNAAELTEAEALKASIQIYSPIHSRYFEVGHVSHYLDFISQRILFNVREKKDLKFPHLVGGPILKSSILIAALIENGYPLSVPKNSGQKSQVEEFKSLFK